MYRTILTKQELANLSTNGSDSELDSIALEIETRMKRAKIEICHDRSCWNTRYCYFDKINDIKI